MLKLLVINGPNLNFTGIREKSIYGDLTLEQINKRVCEFYKDSPVILDFFQSNHEGMIIDKIQSCLDNYSGIVINPGAYSHYSIAIMDALRAVNVPAVEVHLSNIYNREEYRRNSVTASACEGVISGFGYYGYIMAVGALINKFGS